MEKGQKKVLVIGAGDIGRRVIVRLKRRATATAITSRRANRPILKRLGAHAVLADLDRPATLKRLPTDWNTLIHCAPPPTHGTGDSRTANLLRVLRANPGQRPPQRSPKRPRMVARSIVYLSTSGVYGDHGGALVSESAPLKARNPRAIRRVDAERRLTRAAKRHQWRLAILRVPGIYASDRLPIERLKAGTPAILAAEDSYTNHIHAADLAGIVIAALDHAARRPRPRTRIYNACDDSDMKMGDYFDRVAAAFGLAPPPRLPRAQVATAVSPMLYSFMRESRRLDNTRLKRELRYGFEFPTVDAGLAAMRMRA